jgi:HAD superfamily hydrolase (TIGR01509 family)
MSKLQALIFDVDGTLADTERDGHRVAFNQAFADAGLDWDWTVDVYGDLLSVTGGKERIRFFLQKYQPDFSVDGDLTEFIASLHKTKTDHYLKLLQQGRIPLRPGVERLLHEAKEAGLTLGIATTTTPANVSYLLKSTLGADSFAWFDVIAAGDIVPAKKPAADIFEYALKDLNLKADQCMAFEDSGNGILSARGAGLKTIVTINNYTRDHDFSDAVLVLDQFGEPDTPCQVLQGAPMKKGYLDVAQIRELFAADSS